MRLLPELVALVAPPACAACRAALGDARATVCPECLRRLPWLRGPRCRRCGLPAHTPTSCPAASGVRDCSWAPLADEGVARDLVTALKFRGALPLSGLMGAQLAANLPAAMRSPAPAVVPVPPQPARTRWRGHHPAGALASELARRRGWPLVECLERRDGSSRQAGAARALRTARGRIVVRVRGEVPQRVVLVDDVHTTGATLEACAVALRHGGASWVGAVAYARAL